MLDCLHIPQAVAGHLCDGARSWRCADLESLVWQRLRLTDLETNSFIAIKDVH